MYITTGKSIFFPQRETQWPLHGEWIGGSKETERAAKKPLLLPRQEVLGAWARVTALGSKRGPELGRLFWRRTTLVFLDGFHVATRETESLWLYTERVGGKAVYFYGDAIYFQLSKWDKTGLEKKSEAEFGSPFP